MRYLIFIYFFTFSLSAYSQNEIYNIGKNRIQYKSFDWEVMYTNNFEFYYNTNALNIAEIASSFLEDKFSELTNNIGHQPFKKTKVFIYNSERDKEQSNIGINEADEFLFSNLSLNNRIIFKVAYNNNLNVFKNNLSYEFNKVLIRDLMHGNLSFAKRFGKVSFINIPEWFSDGAARYLAYGWDTEMDNVIRDYFLTKQKKSLNKISDEQSKYIGQSIWNYISVTYGKNTISNIINLTKIIRNPEKAISSSLGINYNNFIQNWSNYYYSSISNKYIRDELENPELNQVNNFGKVIDLKKNQSGEFILFSAIKGNYKRLVLYNIKQKKFKVLDRIKSSEKNNSYFLDWKNDENILYIKNLKGENNLITRNIYSNSKAYKSLYRFEKINGFSFNTKQNLIALSATVNNQSDIYLLSANSENLKKLTDDMYHDIYPSFLKNSTSVIFSSNRKSIDLENIDSSENISEYYNLYLYNLDTTSTKLYKLTNTLANNIKAKPLTDNKMLFLSDIRGIYNIFSLSIDGNSKQVTDFNTNIINYYYDEIDKDLYFNNLYEGNLIARNKSDFDISKSRFGTQTPRIDYIQKQQSNIKKREKIKRENIKDNINFETTENFSFEGENKLKSSILKNIEINRDNRRRVGNKYKYSVIKNNFNSFLRIDPQEGLGTQVESDFIELFEDHKFYASAFLPFSSLKSSDIFTEYSFLKKRFDFRLSFDRKILFTEDSENFIYHKYLYNQVNFNISYPISEFSRFEIAPFYSTYKFNDLDYRIFNNTPPSFLFYEKNNFYGYFLNFIFNNTNKISYNLEKGTKLKVSFKNYQTENNANTFKNFSVDLSHHQPISENIIFSSRLYYGNSFGENPYKYMLGGVKNSLIRKFEDKGVNDPLLVSNGFNNYNFIFGEYINMRGYDFNKFDGYKVLVLNSEFRIPLVKALTGLNVSSSFLNSLQVAGFFDLGSSWNTNSPFSNKSDVNTWIIKEPGSVFQAEIENSKNPWLASYGISLRSFITDYYVKIDIAKPVEDYQVKDTKFHISFGYSF
ncbi:MAG: hypothetical protein VXY09_00505 [Bacteroidota bacterium]|nr:hypothetical protein [Bacteroidota bacterium]